MGFIRFRTYLVSTFRTPKVGINFHGILTNLRQSLKDRDGLTKLFLGESMSSVSRHPPTSQELNDPSPDGTQPSHQAPPCHHIHPECIDNLQLKHLRQKQNPHSCVSNRLYSIHCQL